MSKFLEIQRNKLLSSYGGVGTVIETIDNLSYIVEEYDRWRIYQAYVNNPNAYRNLTIEEHRLKGLLKNYGYAALDGFFAPDDFEGENIENHVLTRNQQSRTVTARYFPRWFYCPRCHKFQDISDWENQWQHASDWEKGAPACNGCSITNNRRTKRAFLQQVRFVLASLETGYIRDIPWAQLFAAKATVSTVPNAWFFDENTPLSNGLTFHMSRESTDLNGIYVKNARGERVTMAEIINRYFVIEEGGKTAVYQPVVKNANNVYFGYNIASIYIPYVAVTQQDVDTVSQLHTLISTDDAQTLLRIIHTTNPNFSLSLGQIQSIIDAGYQIPAGNLSATSESMYREQEFDFITDRSKYNNGVNASCPKIISHLYSMQFSKPYIKQIYSLRRLTVTNVEVAYSRIDKIGIGNIVNWQGLSDSPKNWFNPATNDSSQPVPVKMLPTCSPEYKSTIMYMPAVQLAGEGFFVELDLDSIPQTSRMIFLHTLCHLIMKELEFVCGYPISSMQERLYYLPKSITGANNDKYGFLIYSASGEEGSYGGITTLFQTHRFDDIFSQALLLAEDCPNDPICENDRGHCFACVDIPETACECFNSDLDRKIVNKYK